jgi:phosphatidylethanolamine-binding protein (PEBP) family uncharacterized protein
MGYKLMTISFVVAVLFFSVSLRREVSGMAAIQITSPAFQNNGMIPRQYTCDGKDMNPPLMIANVPQGAKSLALICDDPDASGTWVHWVLWKYRPERGRDQRGYRSEGGRRGYERLWKAPIWGTVSANRRPPLLL